MPTPSPISIRPVTSPAAAHLAALVVTVALWSCAHWAWRAAPLGTWTPWGVKPATAFAGPRTLAADALAGEAGDSRRSREKEYRVKAALLFKFAKYTKWPPSAFDSEKAPLVVLILGEDPFGKQLEKTFADKKLHGRTIKIVRSKSVPKDLDAHVVFAKGLSSSESKVLYGKLDKSHAMSVGDDEGFARDGGLMNFYHDKGKIKFEVSAEHHESSKVKLDAELLKVAKVIRSSKDAR